MGAVYSPWHCNLIWGTLDWCSLTEVGGTEYSSLAEEMFCAIRSWSHIWFFPQSKQEAAVGLWTNNNNRIICTCWQRMHWKWFVKRAGDHFSNTPLSCSEKSNMLRMGRLLLPQKYSQFNDFVFIAASCVHIECHALLFPLLFQAQAEYGRNELAMCISGPHDITTPNSMEVLSKAGICSCNLSCGENKTNHYLGPWSHCRVHLRNVILHHCRKKSSLVRQIYGWRKKGKSADRHTICITPASRVPYSHGFFSGLSQCP